MTSFSIRPSDNHDCPNWDNRWPLCLARLKLRNREAWPSLALLFGALEYFLVSWLQTCVSRSNCKRIWGIDAAKIPSNISRRPR